MKTLLISIANPIHKQQIEPITIEISASLGEGAVNARFNVDAKLLANALMQSLPCGTLDALLVELLKHKQSVLRVAYEAE